MNHRKDQQQHCHCNNDGPGKAPLSRLLGISGGVVIALLPKCPFCLLAYSSAMTLCSGTTVFEHQSNWFSWVSILLTVLVIATLIRNFRGLRTLVALALALIGGGLIAYSELYTGYLGHYTTGAYLLLGGALLNGGFYLFVRRALGRWFPGASRSVESSS